MKDLANFILVLLVAIGCTGGVFGWLIADAFFGGGWIAKLITIIAGVVIALVSFVAFARRG
jgi:cation transporter-like permease